MTTEDIEAKIDRVEAIRSELQQAESMNPADAKALRDEAMTLLAELEIDIDLEKDENTRLS
jgi:hypothetical protein